MAWSPLMIVVIVNALSCLPPAHLANLPDRRHRPAVRQRLGFVRSAECTGTNGESGHCLFQWDCKNRSGTLAGYCKNGFLFQSCCLLDPVQPILNDIDQREPMTTATTPSRIIKITTSTPYRFRHSTRSHTVDVSSTESDIKNHKITLVKLTISSPQTILSSSTTIKPDTTSRHTVITTRKQLISLPSTHTVPAYPTISSDQILMLPNIATNLIVTSKPNSFSTSKTTLATRHTSRPNLHSTKERPTTTTAKSSPTSSKTPSTLSTTPSTPSTTQTTTLTTQSSTTKKASRTSTWLPKRTSTWLPSTSSIPPITSSTRRPTSVTLTTKSDPVNENTIPTNLPQDDVMFQSALVLPIFSFQTANKSTESPTTTPSTTMRPDWADNVHIFGESPFFPFSSTTVLPVKTTSAAPIVTTKTPPPETTSNPPETSTSNLMTTMSSTTTLTSSDEPENDETEGTTQTDTTTTQLNLTVDLATANSSLVNIMTQALEAALFNPKPDMVDFGVPNFPIRSTSSASTPLVSKGTTNRPLSTSRPSQHWPTFSTPVRPSVSTSGIVVAITTPKPTRRPHWPKRTTTPSYNETTNTSTPAPLDYKIDCGVRPLMPNGRIVGGKPSMFGEWPWQVLIKEAAWLGLVIRNKCGGVLVHKKYVISAAHCQPGFLSALVVILGDYDLSTFDEELRPIQRSVKRVVVHKDYNAATFENDMALLELDKAVDFMPHVVPVCLPEKNEDFSTRSAAVSGWGRTRYGGPIPTVLHSVEVPILNNNDCQLMFYAAGHTKNIRDSFVCAGYADGNHDSCEGDSGGPLMTKRDNGQWVLVGTVSHGIKCAYPNLPGVYMRTAFYKDWIDKVIFAL